MTCLGLFTSCGGGLYTTNAADTPALSESTAAQQIFSLGSDYPAGLVIPDLSDARDTAFVVSIDNPTGLLAIDLDVTPLQLSRSFAGCLVPSGTGIPTGAVQMISAQRALLLTSSHLIDCNPRSGAINASVALPTRITLPQPAPLSRPFDLDNNGTLDSQIQNIPLSYPSDLLVRDNIAYVSFSNLVMPVGDVVAAPGAVLQWALRPQAPYLQASTAAPIITSHFNPTSMRAYNANGLLIGMSGVSRIQNGVTVPTTASAVDLIDLTTRDTDTVQLGMIAAAPRQLLLSTDQHTALLPSAATGNVYAVDLQTFTVTRDATQPIALTSATHTSDYLAASALSSQGTLALIGSFNTSQVFPVALESLNVLPSDHATPITLGQSAGISSSNPTGSPTGIGALACRPGLVGVDFAGHDCFALTASPGQLIGFTVGEHTADIAPASAVPAPTSPGVTPVVSPTTPVTTPPATPEPSTPTTPTPPTSALPPPPAADQLINPAANGTQAYPDAVAQLQLGTGGGAGGPGKLCGSAPCYPANVLGHPQGSASLTEPNIQPNAILSLGCNGSITLDLGDVWVADGPGADLLVFENAFYPNQVGAPAVAEPGIVSVSINGTKFYEFSCGDEASQFAGCAGTLPTKQLFGYGSNPNAGTDPTNPSIAGGNTFDLRDIGVPYARYVRIRDKNCAGGYGGFDLDGVSVVWGIVPQ